MSQQYGPPGQGPQGPAGQGGHWQQPGPPPQGQPHPPQQPYPPQQPQAPYGGQQRGYGAGPMPGQGPFGYPPGHQFDRRRKGMGKAQLAAIAGGSIAVLLIILGIVLLLTSGSEDEPVATPSTAPATSVPTTVPTPTETTHTKGPNDVGVEIGNGVWFTPQQGWVRDKEKRSGANYFLPEPGRPGAIDGWFWARQTEFMGAKEFAHHLVDVESNNLENVRIRSGRTLRCPSPALRTCYAINYSAVVRPKGRPPVIFAGFVQSFEDKDGLTTATDSALEGFLWKQKYPEIQQMVNSMVKSF